MQNGQDPLSHLVGIVYVLRVVADFEPLLLKFQYSTEQKTLKTISLSAT
jgi:hypothetical protein